ncbi:MAG: preprotein translocase subunit YajC [Finegoldia sp.]|nr:preprotein translocase subunit YajC [Finegoldia sp.]
MAEFLVMVLPFIMVLAVMYFLMIRPQQKQQKRLLEMRESLRVGDNVITAGGIVGKIVRVTDDYVTLETADTTKIEFLKTSVVSKVTTKKELVEEIAQEEIEEENETIDA